MIHNFYGHISLHCAEYYCGNLSKNFESEKFIKFFLALSIRYFNFSIIVFFFINLFEVCIRRHVAWAG
jgi:hypothetical protein